jgi:transcriptional regulator with XRE-family HTH domain
MSQHSIKSKASLAKNIGITPAQLDSHFRKDAVRLPRAEILLQIAEYFQVSMSYLITGEDKYPIFYNPFLAKISKKLDMLDEEELKVS